MFRWIFLGSKFGFSPALNVLTISSTQYDGSIPEITIGKLKGTASPSCAKTWIRGIHSVSLPILRHSAVRTDGRLALSDLTINRCEQIHALVGAMFLGGVLPHRGPVRTRLHRVRLPVTGYATTGLAMSTLIRALPAIRDAAGSNPAGGTT